MSKKTELDFGLDFKSITKYDAQIIEDKDMIRKDFRKAAFITFLSITSAFLVSLVIYLL